MEALWMHPEYPTTDTNSCKPCFCLVVFFASALIAQAESFDFCADGSATVHPDYTVDTERIARIPRWSPKDYVSPPLELNDALRRVRALIQKQSAAEEYHLRNIEITRKEAGTFGSIYYYQFSYIRYKGNDYSNAKDWIVIVLMDGTLLASDPSKL